MARGGSSKQRRESRRHSTRESVRPFTIEMSANKSGHHVRELLLAGLAALMEYLAVKHGAYPLALGACVFFYWVFHEYTKNFLSNTTAKVRYGARTLVAIVLIVAMGALVGRGNKLPPESVAKETITVSPTRIAVTSSKWSGYIDVSVTNHLEQPWYDCDFLVNPSSLDIEFSVEPLAGLGSEVGSLIVKFTDASWQWPILRIAPKGTVVFRIKSRLKSGPLEGELRFYTLPGSSEPTTRQRSIP